MYKFIKITDNIQIGMYGLCIAVGLLLAFILLGKYAKHRNIDQKFFDKIETTSIIAIVGGFGFAFLFQAVYNFFDSGVFYFGGMTFVGGLIGGIITFFAAFFLIFRRNLVDAWRNFNKILVIIPGCITLAHGFGRIGCFFAGCCYGKETESWLGMEFKYGESVGTKVYPTQLYEAIFLFIVAAILIYLAFKIECKYNLGIYLTSYGVFRFLIEYLRGDYRGSFIPGLSPSQFWSILLTLAGVLLILFMTNKIYKPTWYYQKLEEYDRQKALEEEEEAVEVNEEGNSSQEIQ